MIDEPAPRMARNTDWLYRRPNMDANKILHSEECRALLLDPDALVTEACAALEKLLGHHEELIAYRGIGYVTNPDNSRELQLAVRLRLIDLFGKSSVWARTLVFNVTERHGPQPSSIPARIAQRTVKALDDETERVAELCTQRLALIGRYRRDRNRR